MWKESSLILCYHHIAETPRENEAKRFYVSPLNFEKQMRYLYKNEYCVLDLSELAEILRKKKKIPKKSIVLTFDDGYKSFLFYAKSILKSYGFSATVFIPTGKVGSANDWYKKEKDDIDLMSWDEIRSLLTDGFFFHSHTASHANLIQLCDSDVMNELEESKKTLESMLKQKEHFFCYPFSGFDERIKRLVKEAGYMCACTSSPGKNDTTTDTFLLKRVEIENNDSMPKFICKIYYNHFLGQV